jgi:hypothetical protein
MSLVAVITAQEEMLLREAVGRSQPALSSLVDELVADVRRLTADEGNALRDAVGTELVCSGFAEDWEPNDRGLALEDLIDKLGRVTAVFDS